MIENLDSHSPLDEFDPILRNLTIDFMVVNKDGSFAIFSKGYIRIWLVRFISHKPYLLKLKSIRMSL